MSSITASFVIVNYNRKEELLTTLELTKKIIKTVSGQFEIIVVDNASTDGSAPVIKEQHPDIILIENSVNTGAPAWNLGFQKAKGEYFIILDDDSHIESGLDKAISYLHSHNDVGILALNITGGAYNTAKWNDMDEMAGFIGCGAIINRKLYEKVGGYAEWMFLYTNEWELGIRTLEAGFKIIYFAGCHVTHRTSSINRTSKRLIVFSVKHEMAIVYKYFSANTRQHYVNRVFLNNLKGIFKYGLPSMSWYLEAMKEFKNWKKTMVHTPVSKSVEEFYARRFWSTNPVLSFMLPSFLKKK